MIIEDLNALEELLTGKIRVLLRKLAKHCPRCRRRFLQLRDNAKFCSLRCQAADKTRRYIERKEQ